jgi:hypothetical protein
LGMGQLSGGGGLWIRHSTRMRKLLLVLVLFLPVALHAQTWNPLPGGADVLVNMNTSTPGTAMTTAIMTAGSVINANSGYGSITIGSGFTVGTNQGLCTNLGPVTINGTGGATFPDHSLNYNSIAFLDSTGLSNIEPHLSGAGAGKTVMSFTACIYVGPPASIPGADWDRFGMWAGGGGEYSMIQWSQTNCTTQAPPSGYTCLRMEGKPTSHSGYFFLQSQHAYWVSGWWNDSNATVNGQPAGTMLLHAYTIDGTPIPCMTASGCTTLSANGPQAADVITNQTAIVTTTDHGGGLSFFNIGNNESGTGSGTSSYFQNEMINFTTAPFPLFWTPNTTVDPWAGSTTFSLLAPSRGADWSNAGVVGGIPARTSPICASEPAGTPASTINADATACSGSGGGLVNLASGSFSGTLAYASNVTIRGAGANLTTFTSTGNWNLASGVNPGDNLTTWTPGGGAGGTNPFPLTNSWPTGIHTISLASSTNLKVGTLLEFDQLDQTVDYGNILVTQSTTALTAVAPGVAGAYVSQGDGQNVSRGTCTGALSGCNSQQQAALVTQCDGVTTVGHVCGSAANITINPPILMSNWGYDPAGTSLSPSVWYSTNLPVQNAGIEDIGIDMTSCSGCVMVVRGGYSDWLKGIAVTNFSPANNGTINTPYSLNLTIVNNYVGVSTVSGTGVYGINAQYCTMCKMENNIGQLIPTPFIFNGGGVGNVWGYNYQTGGFYTASSQYNIPAFGDHAAGIAKNLFEGNITNGYTGDSIHGLSTLETFFRNNFWGTYPSCWLSGATEPTSIYGQCTQNMTVLNTSAGHRLASSIGNVFGTIGVQSLYSTTSFVTGVGSSYAIYQYGSQTSSVADSANLQQTAAIWGNTDAVTSVGFTTPRFNCSEMTNGTAWDSYGTSIGAVQQQRFYNPCPTVNTLPASFYYSAKPSWWPSGKAWPIIGPDVTGGNLLTCSGGTQTRAFVTTTTTAACTGAGGTTSTYANGLVYSNPAMDCYLSLGGLPNGTGGPLTNFNEATCYSGVTPPNANPPSCTPGTGTYFVPLTVTCSDTSSGAIMCYTTNGTSPITNGATGCTNGTLYTTTLSPMLTTTVMIVAGGTGYIDSAIVTYVYTIEANPPVCIPGGGVYNSAQSVNCSTTSPSTILCYTTNGSTPAINGGSSCAFGTLYTGTITVLATETLTISAGGLGYEDSAPTINIYSIIPPPAPKVQVFTLF